MAPTCPGRKANASLDTEIVACPECGREIEIFGDEFRVHCRCSIWVFRGKELPSCAQWCSEAERCFGTIGKVTPGERKASNACDPAELEREMEAMKQRVAEAVARCSKPEEQCAGAPGDKE